MSPIITDWVEFEQGYKWRRRGDQCDVIWPKDKPFKLPFGYRVDRNRNYLPQNIEDGSWSISPYERQVCVPVLGWSSESFILSGSVETMRGTETVYYAKNLGDSHSIYSGGSITIPISGTYIYQLKDMPMAKSEFKAGHVIEHPVNILFKVGP